MEPLDKLEMIYQSMQNEKKVELDRCKKPEPDPYGARPLYVQRLENEIDMLSVIICKLQAVKENHHSVRDEMVQKMYGP